MGKRSKKKGVLLRRSVKTAQKKRKLIFIDVVRVPLFCPKKKNPLSVCFYPKSSSSLVPCFILLLRTVARAMRRGSKMLETGEKKNCRKKFGYRRRKPSCLVERT